MTGCPPTLEELSSLLRQGAGLTVSADQLSFAELSAVARQLDGSAVLHITDSFTLSDNQMSVIARQPDAPAYVKFS